MITLLLETSLGCWRALDCELGGGGGGGGSATLIIIPKYRYSVTISNSCLLNEN